MKSLLTSLLSGLLLVSLAAPAFANDTSCDGDKKGGEDKKEKNPA